MGPIELIAKFVLFSTVILVLINPYLKKKYGEVASSENQATAAEKKSQTKIIIRSLLWTAFIGAIPTLLFIGHLQELTAKGDGLFRFGVSIMLLPLLFLFLYFVFAISIAIISARARKK